MSGPSMSLGRSSTGHCTSVFIERERERAAASFHIIAEDLDQHYDFTTLSLHLLPHGYRAMYRFSFSALSPNSRQDPGCCTDRILTLLEPSTCFGVPGRGPFLQVCRRPPCLAQLEQEAVGVNCSHVWKS